MASAYIEKVDVPVHLILNPCEATELKKLLQNWLSNEPEPEECALMRASVSEALHDVELRG